MEGASHGSSWFSHDSFVLVAGAGDIEADVLFVIDYRFTALFQKLEKSTLRIS
jgi:hypothetical protein